MLAAHFIDRREGFSDWPSAQVISCTGFRAEWHLGALFGRAEDALLAMLEAGPIEPKLLDFGIAFYQRLARLSDSNLSAGNLSHAEVNVGLADLEGRRAALEPP